MSGVGKPWEIKAIPEQLKHVRALTVKKGNWLGVKNDFPKPFDIPFIDERGKFTGCTLYKACLSSQSFLATVISTVSSRLRGWARSHNRIKFKSKNHLEYLITRSSTLYSLTKNSYMMDRLLVLFKDFERHKKAIAGIVACFASKLDANKGFIYGQACSHAHWLTSRASRPRDKSSPDQFSYPLREVGVSNFSQKKEFIFDALYVTTSVVAQVGSIIMRRLRNTYSHHV